MSATAELLTLRCGDSSLVSIGQRLKATTQRMAKLIDDVMDFARGRLRSGIGLSLRLEDDLCLSLLVVVAEPRQARRDRKVIDDITIARPVHCDLVRVQQLFSNLLGNALTHGAAELPVFVRALIHGGDLVLSVRMGVI